MDYELDELDERILFHLTRDARNTSAPDVAAEMDVSAGTVRNRIRNLEETGVIRGYHADVDYEACGGLLTNLFVCSSAVAEQERLAERVLRIPGVVNVREVMTGRGNLQVKAIGTDTDDLTRVARKLTNLGLDIEDEDLLHDEHFHPYHEFGPESEPEELPVDDTATPADERTVTVAPDAPIAGRTLEEANKSGLIEEDVVVVAVERDQSVLTPRGDTRIEPADRVRLFSPDGVPARALDAFESST